MSQCCTEKRLRGDAFQGPSLQGSTPAKVPPKKRRTAAESDVDISGSDSGGINMSEGSSQSNEGVSARKRLTFPAHPVPDLVPTSTVAFRKGVSKVLLKVGTYNNV